MFNVKWLWFGLGCWFLWSNCQPKITYRSVTSADIVYEPGEQVPKNFGNRNKGCNDPLAYRPDTNYLEHFPMRYIRVNVHFMNSTDGTKNFDETEAVAFAKALLKSAEYDLKRQKKLAIPPNNDLPALPKRYRYVLTPRPNDPNDTGVYCHYDDELFYFINKGKNRNNSDPTVIKKYAIQEDSVLNIFIMPHHPDSVKSKTYKVRKTGIALRNHLKIAGIYESGRRESWKFKGLLNHEIGHVLGLSHAWGYDGCEDTPVHPNCWNITEEPPCDTMASNNVMDYNAHQSAWTPCQIGKVHRNLSNLKSRQRRLLIRDWCALDSEKTISIRDHLIWEGAKDLAGHLIIENGGILKINCRVSLPKNAKVVVHPKGQLILENNAYLHNDCGDQWAGIEVQQVGKVQGQVIFRGNPTIENIPSPLTVE